MKQKTNTLSFFICSAIITLAIISAMCFIASLELKNDSFKINLDTLTAQLFGRTYVIDKDILNVLTKILDFNKVFVGQGVFDAVKNAIITVFQVILDILRIIFYTINSTVNASAVNI